MNMTPKAVDQVEILTLQDNYIDITATDNTEVVTRAIPLKEGEIRASIVAEHGFSALVTTSSQGRSRCLLFDFGFSEDGAARNVKTLGVDLTKIEAAVLSHGHSDHTGGMRALGALAGGRKTPLFVHPAAFKSPRYLKMGPALRINFPKLTKEMVEEAGFTPVATSEPRLILDDTVLFLGEIPRKTDFERGFPIAYWEDGGTEKWDAIEDDTSIVMNVRNRGLVILSGCAHAGVVNTVRHAVEVTGIDKIHAVMGGFHLSGPLFEPIIERTTEELMRMKPDYVVPMHCTGRKAIMAMEGAMGKAFLLNMAGTKTTFRAA